MIAIGDTEAVLLGAVACALILIGMVLLYLGARARAEAATVRLERDRLDAMLRAGPAQAMVMRSDGRIEMPRRLADWLGLADVARFLEELT